MLSREVTTAAGSAPTIVSGTGSSHGISCFATSSASAVELGAPRPVGIGRRSRLSSAVRQVRVAILYSQVRRDERPSNRS